MRDVSIEEITGGFPGDTYLPEGDFIVGTHDSPNPKLVAERLSKWGFSTVTIRSEAPPQESTKKPQKPTPDAVEGSAADAAAAAPTIDFSEDDVGQEDTVRHERTARAFRAYMNLMDQCGALCESFRKDGAIPLEVVTSAVEDVVEIADDNFDHLLDFPSFDSPGGSYLPRHLVNCTFLAVAFARSAKLKRDYAIVLGLAGFLHDMGMSLLPDSLLKEEGSLAFSDLALIRQHPYLAYESLVQNGFPRSVAQAALRHQVLLDYSGYPVAESPEKLVFYDRAIAAISAFVASMEYRPYAQTAISENSPLEFFDPTQKKYDRRILLWLHKLFEQLPYGSPVRLANGTFAVVSRVEATNTMVVRSVADAKLRPVRRRVFIRTRPGSSTAITQWFRPGDFGKLLATARRA